MRTPRNIAVRVASAVCAALFLFMSAAQAGPPLICHQIEIGNAKSLPWISDGWNLTGAETYDTKNLVSDTLAILDSSAPVLVRMETLRRATMYARNNPQAARELLTKLYARAINAESAGRPDALAWFDAGYLAEVDKQMFGREAGNPAAGLDGYAWVKKAVAMRGDDSQMEFAAALIAFSDRKDDAREHLEKAMAGAKSDPLLAKNLDARFNPKEGATMAELLSSNPTAKKSN